MSGDGLASSQDRRVLIAVLAKVSFYYAALFSLVFALLTAFPNLITMLPVGGVGQLSSGAELEIMQLEDAMLSGDFDEGEDAYTAIESPPSLLFDDARNLFFSMLGALLLMFPVSWVYRRRHTTAVANVTFTTLGRDWEGGASDRDRGAGRRCRHRYRRATQPGTDVFHLP